MTYDRNSQHGTLATSVSLLVWSRISMAITPPLLVALSIAGSAWLDNKFASADEFQVVRDEVKAIQINNANGRADRIEFQNETTRVLREISIQVNLLSNNIATLNAKLEQTQRELDRRIGPSK